MEDKENNMRIAEYKQIDTKIVNETITIYDEETGEESEKVIEREVPVMGMVYRDMTEEEEAELAKAQEDIPPIEPTQEDRLEAQVLYTALMTDTLLEE